MGLSSLTDAVTGLSIPSGAPTVAVVISQLSSGYPNPQTTGARPAVGINHLFEPFSLPLNGQAGDYSDFTPSSDQLALEALLGVANVKSWPEFAETALDWQKGIVFPDRLLRVINPSAPDPEPQVLGLCAVTEPTYRSLVEGSPRYANREHDINLVLAVVEDVLANRIKTTEDYYRYSILSLKAGAYEYEDGTRISLPRLAASLSEMEFDGALPSKLTSHLTSEKYGVLGFALRQTGHGPDQRRRLEALLGVLFDWQCFADGLSLQNRYLMPSASGGQYANHKEVARMAVTTAEQAIDSIIAHFEDDRLEEEQVTEQVNAVLDRMESLTVRARERLDDALGRVRNQRFGR